MPANPTQDHDDGSSRFPQRRTLTRSEFDSVLLKMRARSIKAVERTTVLIDGMIDGVPMLAAFDLMTNVGYLEACDATGHKPCSTPFPSSGNPPCPSTGPNSSP